MSKYEKKANAPKKNDIPIGKFFLYMGILFVVCVGLTVLSFLVEVTNNYFYPIMAVVCWLLFFYILSKTWWEFKPTNVLLWRAFWAARNKRWDKFNRLMEKARVVVAKKPWHGERLGNLLILAAEMRRMNSQYSAAEILYQEATQVCERLDKPNAMTSATCYVNRGVNFQDWGRFEEAEHLYRKAYQMVTDAGPEVRWIRILIDMNRGVMAMDTGQWEAARTLLTQLDESVPQVDNAELLECIITSSLAKVALYFGDFQRADEYARIALSMEEVFRTQGEMYRANPLSALGLLNFRMGRYREARDFYEQILDIYHTEWKNLRTPPVAKVNLWLASIALMTGNLARAEELFREALQIFAEYQVPDCHAMAEHLQRYGELLRSQGRNEEADAMTERAKQAAVALTFLDRAHEVTKPGKQHQITPTMHG